MSTTTNLIGPKPPGRLQPGLPLEGGRGSKAADTNVVKSLCKKEPNWLSLTSWVRRGVPEAGREGGGHGKSLLQPEEEPCVGQPVTEFLPLET